MLLLINNPFSYRPIATRSQCYRCTMTAEDMKERTGRSARMLSNLHPSRSMCNSLCCNRATEQLTLCLYCIFTFIYVCWRWFDLRNRQLGRGHAIHRTVPCLQCTLTTSPGVFVSLQRWHNGCNLYGLSKFYLRLDGITINDFWNMANSLRRPQQRQLSTCGQSEGKLQNSVVTQSIKFIFSLLWLENDKIKLFKHAQLH